jgi:hypothetical protein
MSDLLTDPYIAELRNARTAPPSSAPASPSRDALQALPLCHTGVGDLSHPCAAARTTKGVIA